MARRINVTVRDLNNNETKSQMCNQEGRDLLELKGEAFNKHVNKLIERTIHRIYGPNGAMILTQVKSPGRGVKDAGWHGFVGHKANWGGEDRPRLFNQSRRVVITLQTDDGQPILPEVEVVNKVSQPELTE